MPLREVRSEVVGLKLLDSPDNILERHQSDGPWIAVRFIFQKKLISSIRTS